MIEFGREPSLLQKHGANALVSSVLGAQLLDYHQLAKPIAPHAHGQPNPGHATAPQLEQPMQTSNRRHDRLTPIQRFTRHRDTIAGRHRQNTIVTEERRDDSTKSATSPNCTLGSATISRGRSPKMPRLIEQTTSLTSRWGAARSHSSSERKLLRSSNRRTTSSARVRSSAARNRFTPEKEKCTSATIPRVAAVDAYVTAANKASTSCLETKAVQRFSRGKLCATMSLAGAVARCVSMAGAELTSATGELERSFEPARGAAGGGVIGAGRGTTSAGAPGMVNAGSSILRGPGCGDGGESCGRGKSKIVGRKLAPADSPRGGVALTFTNGIDASWSGAGMAFSITSGGTLPSAIRARISPLLRSTLTSWAFDARHQALRSVGNCSSVANTSINAA